MSIRCALVLSIICTVTALISCVEATEPRLYSNVFSTLSGPYLGQYPPGTRAKIFMPGIISTYGRDGNISWADEGRFLLFTNDEIGTRITLEKNGKWIEPELVPWAWKTGLMDYTLGGNGKTVYRQSRQLTSPDDSEPELNIWITDWTGSGWTEIRPLPPIVNSPEYNEIYPTATADGSGYYFSIDRPESLGADIYFNKLVDGTFEETSRMAWPINSEFDEVDFIIAPDESYLIFSSDRPGGFGLSDNYICFMKEDARWSSPLNLGKDINSYGNEIRCSLTFDGRYFFFGSTREAEVPKGEFFESQLALRYGDNDVYWVDAGPILALRDVLLNRKNAAESAKTEYAERGVKSSIGLLKRIRSAKRDEYFFSIYELLKICDQMISDGETEGADECFKVLLEILPEEAFRIRHGYALVCLANGQTSKGLGMFKELALEKVEFDFQNTLKFLLYDELHRDRNDDWIEILQFSIGEFPDNYYFYFKLAQYHEEKGNLELAIDNYRKTLELNAGFEEAAERLKTVLSN